MIAFWRSGRDRRDEIVRKLEEAADGSFVIVSQALENVAKRVGDDTPMNVNDLLVEIQKLRAAGAEKAA